MQARTHAIHSLTHSLTCRRKQQQIAARLNELGIEALEERLQSAAEAPLADPYKLSRLIAETIPLQGRPVLLFELCRSPTHPTSADLAALASRLFAADADALIVCIDSDDTPEGLSDLFAVSRTIASMASAKNIPPAPILARDWFLHPLQVVEAKEAGCAGILGVVASITGPKGTPVLSSFAAAIGLDCPCEIINLAEMKAMEAAGVPFYAVNISVQLSVSIPGFGRDVARGLLGELPFGAVSVVGVKSVEEGREARAAGADVLFVKRELVGEWVGREGELVGALKSATNSDD